MAALVGHAADQHGLAEILHARADTETPPRFRETAIRGDDQARLQPAAIAQPQRDTFGAAAQLIYGALGQQLDIRTLLHGCMSRTANRLVGHQAAQALLAGCGSGDTQCVGRWAVEHLGIAQYSDFIATHALP